MKMSPLLLSVFLLLITLGSPVFAARFEISAPGEQLIPLALTELLPQAAPDRAIAKEFGAALQGDLELSGLFDLVDPAAFLGDAERLGLTSSEVDFGQWRALGSDALIKGGYLLSGDHLTIDLRLFDVVTQRLLTGKRYTGSRKDLRKIAHRFADEVLESLTGTGGPFAARIGYISNRSGRKELYLMDVDGHNSVQISAHSSIVLNPDFSPTRKEMIFTSYKNDNPDLYRKEVYTGRESRLSLQPGLNVGGRYSPDGREIALTLSKDNNSEIYLIGTDGSIHQRLTNHYGIDVDPSWSPQGDKIAFVSDRRGNPNIFIVDVFSRAVERLTFAGKYNSTPAWNPKSSRIAFTRLENGVFDIYSIEADGSDERRLTFGPGSKEHPRWSPDGRFLIYSLDLRGEKSLWIMRADGTGGQRISAPGGDDTHPAWSTALF